jgi:hypothetical protein
MDAHVQHAQPGEGAPSVDESLPRVAPRYAMVSG